MPYYVYILSCSDHSYYTGSTSDLSRRLTQHEAGADPYAYTCSRRPVQLAWAQECATKEDALRLEKQIKGWSRSKKEALIQNDYNKIHEIVKNEREEREQQKLASTALSTCDSIIPERNAVKSKGASTALSTGAFPSLSVVEGTIPERSANVVEGTIPERNAVKSKDASTAVASAPSAQREEIPERSRREDTL